ncbi:MAG: hypothetical protein LBR19_06065 [Bifidobacteriaceae bacterium]|jgi:hypothetical protein|nr:hypothetical protein [Bifidobacteriaceae bacterium]
MSRSPARRLSAVSALTAALLAAGALALGPAAQADPPPAVALSTPVIVGGAGVGLPLTVTASYAPTTAQVTYQWFKGTSVVGTGKTYTIQPADKGQDLVAKVTVSAGGQQVVKYSNHIQVLGMMWVGAAAEGRAGYLLAVMTQHVPLAGVSLTYEWFKDGKRVGGAPTYLSSQADIGGDFVVKVTASMAGAGTSVKYSNHFTVIPWPPTG